MTISNVTGVRTDISDMLSKMREISSKSQVFTGKSLTVNNNLPQISQSKSFADTLSVVKDVVSNVSNMQVQTDHIKDAYMAGDKNVSMSQMLIASQKSKLAFEGLVTVRNKILDAYKEIMNMPV